MSDDPTLLQYVKSIDERTEKMSAALDAGFTQMDGRVRRVESFQDKQKGIMGAGGLIVAVTSWLLAHIEKGAP